MFVSLLHVLPAVMMFPVSRILEKRLCFSANKGILSLNVKGVSVCGSVPVHLHHVALGETATQPLTNSTSTFTPTLPPLLQTILRIVLILISVLVVLIIPNFSILMALVGSGCCTLLAFILPAVFHWKLFAE